MARTDVEQTYEQVISPRLDDVVPSTDGIYYVKNIYEVDSTNLTAVGFRHEITLGPESNLS